MARRPASGVATRLARTSRGWIAFELGDFPGVGTAIKIMVFDNEGAGTQPTTWTEKHGSRRGVESFEDFLVNEAQLQPEEAADLAFKVTGPWLAEWRETDVDSSRRDRFAVLFYGGLIAVLALAVLGFA